MKKLAEQVSELMRAGREFAVCTVVNTKGSTPRKIGAKMIVLPDGSFSGTVGGGELEKRVITDAVKMIREKTPQLFRYDLLHQLNMCCGGTVEIFIEPVMKQERLYIFGAGHVGQALAAKAAGMDFDIFLIDERRGLLDEVHDDNVSKMNLPYMQALSALPFDADTYICIMTYSHPVDRDILAFCLGKPFAYLGMIGSRRKTEVTKKMFREAGIATEEQLGRVDMPMGIDIGAEGPAEIAVSILAKLIEVKNRGKNGKKEKAGKDNSISTIEN